MSISGDRSLGTPENYCFLNRDFTENPDENGLRSLHGEGNRIKLRECSKRIGQFLEKSIFREENILLRTLYLEKRTFLVYL